MVALAMSSAEAVAPSRGPARSSRVVADTSSELIPTPSRQLSGVDSSDRPGRATRPTTRVNEIDPSR